MKKEQFSSLDLVLMAFIGWFIGLIIGMWILSDEAHADVEPRYKIAVLDTGFDPSKASVNVKLCKTGHYDAMTKSGNINFIHPHGTKVSSIIAQKLENVDYCLIIFQVFQGGMQKPLLFEDVAKALSDISKLHVDAINISFSGMLPSPIERKAFTELQKTHIPVFVAAGNSGENLDKNCRHWPACYELDNIITVGAQDPDDPKSRAPTSNWGKRVQIWAPGYYHDGNSDDFGTSFAAPRALAEYILFLEHKRLHPVKAKTKCLNKPGGQEGYCG